MPAKQRIMRDFAINEISAVTKPAQKGARMVIMKRDDSGNEPDILDNVEKGGGGNLLLTTDVAGHAHLIDFGEYEEFKGGGTTGPGYVAVDGMQRHHMHPYVVDGDGNITIGATCDHTHELAATRQTIEELGPEIVKLSATERRTLARRGLALPDGSYPIRSREDLDDAIQAFGRAPKDKRRAVALHIRARARALDAMDALPSDGVLADILGGAKKSTAEKESSDMANAELEKQLAEMTAIAGMNDKEKTHLNKLSGDARDAFLKADATARAAIIEKANGDDPVVYTTKAGVDIRKSDGLAVAALAKSHDALHEENATLKSVLEVTKATNEAKEIDEVVAKLAHIGKPVEEKRVMVAAIMKLDDTAKKSALDVLMAGADQFAAVAKFAGVPALGSAAKSAHDELNELVSKRLAKAESGVTYEKAVSEILMTPRGAELYELSLSPAQRGIQH